MAMQRMKNEQNNPEEENRRFYEWEKIFVTYIAIKDIKIYQKFL